MESANFEQQLQEQSLQEHYVGCPPSVADHRRLYNRQFGGGVASSGLHDQWSTTSILSTTSSNSNSYIKYENNEIPEDHKITIPTFSLIASQPFDHPSLFSHHDHQSTHVASSDWFNTFTSGVSHNRESLHHISTYDSLLSQLGLASCSSTSSGLGPNLLGLELLGGSGFEAQVQTQARDTSWSHGDASDQSSNSTSANSPNQKTTSSLTGTKRPATRDHSGPPSKPSALVASKKAQLKSCPPFKVRKEKLGDRIAALHQLVSPFGKTDTASVLTEAIGYIQFLQDQIHNLCMPNAKPPRHKPCRTFRMGPSEEEEKQKPKQDLRSRGLCLMPTSWTSYITPIHMDASHHHYPYF